MRDYLDQIAIALEQRGVSRSPGLRPKIGASRPNVQGSSSNTLAGEGVAPPSSQPSDLLYRPDVDGAPTFTPIAARVRGDFIEYDPPGDDTPPFRTPRPRGFDVDIGPERAHHHSYRDSAFTPGDDEIHQSIQRQVASNPVPGTGDRAATPSGVPNDAGIFGIRNGQALPYLGLDDQVQTYRTTDASGNQVIVNVTRPGEHSLYPGYVAQYVIRTPDGTKVLVVGEGNAILQDGWKMPNGDKFQPGAEAGAYVFGEKVERDIRRGVLDSTRRTR